MNKVIVYYVHPGQRHSHANKAMAEAVRHISNITFGDLYGEYPRDDLHVEREQQRLLNHDVIVFQFPLFWYSTPSLLKEWQDLVLEHGFAYGSDGDKLKGKTLFLAITAAGTNESYTPQGYQHYPLRTFLTPLEQTARLCQMSFPAPYVLHGSIRAQETDKISQHAEGYKRLIEAIRDNTFDFTNAPEIVTHEDVPKLVRT